MSSTLVKPLRKSILFTLAVRIENFQAIIPLLSIAISHVSGYLSPTVYLKKPYRALIYLYTLPKKLLVCKSLWRLQARAPVPHPERWTPSLVYR